MTLPGRADVVIAGGGVVGLSIAFHLAAAGVDVVLLESHSLGRGSSGKPLGGVRAQFSTEANVLLGQRSLRAFERFGDEVGGDIGLHQVGYLFVLRTPQDVATFEASIALQNSLGVPSRLITPSQALELNPYLDLYGVLAAAFSSEDGYAHPGSVVQGYARAAAERGARIVTDTAITGIDVARSRVRAVLTPEGVIEADALICAAGAWSGTIGDLAGVDLPVRPLRRQIALSPALHPAPSTIPFTIDFDSTFYVHNAGEGLLLGMADAGEPFGFGTTYDEDWLPALRVRRSAASPNWRTSPWSAAGPGSTSRRRTPTPSSGDRRASRTSSTQPVSRDTASSRHLPSAR